MRSLYLNSDIIILPSWREGLSKTLIEAASMERPIIATNVPGCKDVVEHGVNGLLVPKKNIEANVRPPFLWIYVEETCGHQRHFFCGQLVFY